MTTQEKNKRFYLSYIKAMSGKEKTREMICKYVENEKLIEHALFFEKLFPKYILIIDELMAEGDQIFVKSHFKGNHEGEADGIPATNRSVESPYALTYKIKNNKIIDFWAIANEMELFEQLGLAREQVEVD